MVSSEWIVVSKVSSDLKSFTHHRHSERSEGGHSERSEGAPLANK